MNRIAKYFIVLAICPLVAVYAMAAPAANSKATATPTPLPKSGTLSGSYTGGPGKTAVDGNWGSGNEIESKSPISGSVSRASGNNWTMKVFNNSKDSYSVDVSVLQLASDGSKIKEDHYSYNLGPSKSEQRSISAQSNTANCSLKLNNWRKTSSAASPTPSPTLAAKTGLKSGAGSEALHDERILPKRKK
jgi:hypothetical protein